MRRRLLALGLLGVGLSLFPPAARADYQIYSTNDPTGNATGYIAANQAASNPNLVIENTDTNFKPGTLKPGTNTVINDPFVIQQFNGANYHQTVNGINQTATLYEVVVSLKYQFENTIQMDFFAPSTTTVMASGVMRLDVMNPLGKLALANAVNTPTFTTAKTLTFTTNGPIGPHYIDPTPKVIASTSAMGYTDQNTLNTFSGKGTLAMPVYANATSSFTNISGNGVGGSRTSAAAALSVTYYYYFVPEPSSMVLTGLGAVGLCVVSRVRNRRKETAAA